ncbi:hypothetical protein [Catellicoccus marimammalium]|uniref:Lipoprotein n=1 Tax=Catellicoccus marimammalium M35/04/3 TaxID=1234409 RepID=K8Z8U1_9ENTE|nr:hypothetical protein [Catellicoccus marimammalium]EKU27315.1 hypothetical protein C683_0646 [Catellicoccus marimammalium M35/04/3]
MKKLLVSFCSLSLLLTLSACGTKEKELQSTIDSQSKEVETLKKEKQSAEDKNKKSAADVDKLKKENKKQKEEIERLKKVLASKKESNRQKQLQQQTIATSTSTPTENTTQSQSGEGISAAATIPEIGPESCASLDHNKIAKEIREKNNRPALTSKGQKIYDQDGNVLTEGQRQEIINNGGGDPVIQVETAEIQTEWAKEHGLLDK